MLRSIFYASPILAAIITYSSTPALAAGFQIFEQNVSGLGSFHSGGAAVADDASTAFYNPAGLTRIKKRQITSSATGIFTQAKFSGDSLRYTDVSPHPMTMLGESGSTSIKGQNAVPAVQAAIPMSDKLFMGLDISVPFGLATNWSESSLVRYQGTESSIRAINFSPNLAYRASNRWSFGGGVDIQRLDATINMIAGLFDGKDYDTRSLNTVNGIGYGWHFGTLYNYSYATRIGVHYRSAVDHNAEGKSRLRMGYLATLNQDLNGTDAANSRAASVHLKLPATTTLSVLHELTHSWDLMGSVYYTGWSVVDELRLEGAAIPGEKTGETIALPTKYHDTYSVNLGTNYHPSSKWQISFGLGYDQTPVSDQYREIRLPDNDRIAAAFGWRYNLSRDFRMDLGYAHIFLKDAKIDNAVKTGHQLAALSGTTKGSADIFGVQMTWTM